MTGQILRLRDVVSKTQLSRSSIYRLESDPTSGFPKRVQLCPGGKSVGWHEHEILAYLEGLQRVAGTPAAPPVAPRSVRRSQSEYLAKRQRERRTPEPQKAEKG